jgi:hypothetical protein
MQSIRMFADGLIFGAVTQVATPRLVRRPMQGGACWRLQAEVAYVPMEFNEGKLTKMKVLKYEMDSASASRSRCEDREPGTFPERIRWNTNRLVTALVAFAFSISLVVVARASDHLDSPATVANPAADIGDVYAWTSPEGKQLNRPLAGALVRSRCI